MMIIIQTAGSDKAGLNIDLQNASHDVSWPQQEAGARRRVEK
jgi:hypothetical protein